MMSKDQQIAAVSGLHPDANLLAAYGDGMLHGLERDAMVLHLADCDVCRRVAFLVQISNQNGAVVKQKPRLISRRVAGVAASIVCFTGLVLSLAQRTGLRPPQHALASVPAPNSHSEPAEVFPPRRLVSRSPRALTRPAASAVRPGRVRFATRKLVALPEPLLYIPVLSAPASLSLRKDSAKPMFGDLDVAKHYRPLKPFPKLLLNSVAVKNWTPTCDEPGDCAILYRKDTFQPLAANMARLPDYLGSSHWQSSKHRTYE